MPFSMYILLLFSMFPASVLACILDGGVALLGTRTLGLVI